MFKFEKFSFNKEEKKPDQEMLQEHEQTKELLQESEAFLKEMDEKVKREMFLSKKLGEIKNGKDEEAA